MSEGEVTLGIAQQHELLLDSIDREDEVDLLEISAFLNSLVEAGSKTEQPNQRSYLRSLIRYWGTYVGNATGTYSSLELYPYSGLANSSDSPTLDENIETSDLTPSELQNLKTFAHFKIIEPIGEGGFAKVFLAEDTRLRRKVALKVFINRSVREELFAQILKNEGSPLQYDHPNILPIYQTDSFRGIPYIAMKYIAGGSLAERMEKDYWRPSVKEILLILQQVSNALNYLHEKNIIHRDIKPGNILLGFENDAYLADFGTAKAIERMYSDDILIGTPSYMALEVLQRPEKATVKADVYSLGVVAYEVFSGKIPFVGTTAEEIAELQKYYTAQPLHQFTDTPQAVSDLIDQCLTRNLDERPAAEDISRIIDRLIESELPQEMLEMRIGLFSSRPTDRAPIPRAGVHKATEAMASPSIDTSSPFAQSQTYYEDGVPPPPTPLHDLYDWTSYEEEKGIRSLFSKLSSWWRRLRSQPYEYPMPTYLPPISSPPPPPTATASSWHRPATEAIDSTASPPQNTVINLVKSPLGELPIGFLVITSELDKGNCLILYPGRYTLGRGLYLTDPAISQHHAKLIYAITEEGLGTFRLVDLGSTNGVKINNDKVADGYLNDNDRITIGKTVLTFIQLKSENLEGKEDVQIERTVTEYD